MWRRQRGQFGLEEWWKRLVLQSGQIKWGLVSFGRVQFFPTGNYFNQMGHSSGCSTTGGRDEFCRGKTILNDKQLPILKVAGRVNGFVVDAGWGVYLTKF